MFEKENRLGEVITSETTILVVESKDSNHMPLLGEFILIHTNTDKMTSSNQNHTTVSSPIDEQAKLIIGIVSHQGYEPKDLRLPLALGLTPTELKEEQPQIANQIRNIFHLLILGQIKNFDKFVFDPFIPSTPAPIHSFVFLLDKKYEKILMEDRGFLLALIDEVRKDESFDNLFLALVRRQLSIVKNKDQKWELLRTVGRMLAKGLHDQSARINSLLRRMALLDKQ